MSDQRLLQIEAPGRAVWKDAPMPEVHRGEVLVRVTGVTTCPHWDMHIMDGEPMFPGASLTYPYVPGQPGHEAVGEVVDVASGVQRIKRGDRVAVWRDPGDRRLGCYARYVPIRAEELLVVPDSMPDEALAPLELAMCVQVSFDQLMERGAVENRRFGIAGLGPAGLIAVQMARAYGATEVVAFDLLPERRALALRLGADEAHPPDDESVAPGRRGPAALDASLDTTGLKRAIEYLIARTDQTVAIFGVLREYVGFGPEHWWGGFALLGYGSHNRAAAERALHLIRTGALRLDDLSTHTMGFDRYAEAVGLLKSKEAIKVLFRP